MRGALDGAKGSLEVITYEDGEEISSTVREAGSYSHMPEGDVHMERGGPEGASYYSTYMHPTVASLRCSTKQVMP